MHLEDYFEFLDSEAREPQTSRAIRIKGYRLGLERVLRYYLDGYNPDEIARAFPGLSLEKIYAAITYYLSHRSEVDRYMTRIREQDEQAYREWAAAGPSPLVQRILAWKAQRLQEQNP
jgi:uncharacterized protein (DUF433 family)